MEKIGETGCPQTGGRYDRGCCEPLAPENHFGKPGTTNGTKTGNDGKDEEQLNQGKGTRMQQEALPPDLF